jgi:hypothetical protein
MTHQEIFAALELPVSAIVNQRVPKKLLVENGAPTTADKRIINEGIEETQWLAALKPSTIGVPEYRDQEREYLEIAVMHIVLRPDAKASRIAELAHRAVPYPLMLLLTANQQLILSLAHIRWAQNEAGKVVLDGEPAQVLLGGKSATQEISAAFLQALSITRQPRINLRVLYQGWLDTLSAFQAAQLTGRFTQSETDEQAAVRRASLQTCREIEQQISALRIAAAKEKQIARQVELNLEIKVLQAKREQAASKL